MQDHRDSISRGGVLGMMTSVAEGTQAVLEGEQRLMDTATSAVRRAIRPSPSARPGRSARSARARRAR
jgi:hypothetical protein